MNLMARKKEIEARLAEIRTASTAETDVEKLHAMSTECDALQEERNQIEAKLLIAGKTEVKMLHVEQKSASNEDLEQRGKDFKEGRTIKVSSNDVLVPTYQDPTLAPYPFLEASEVLDKVRVINLNGGETYTKSFVKSHGEAGLTEEGKPAAETEPGFGYATISKVKVTAYTEVTEELEKLPLINYQAEILRNINISLKKKMSQQILKGSGESNTFTGIFSDSAVALADQAPLEITEITDTTLDDIVFGFGGDEAVEGGAVLILSKPDLAKFAKLRAKDGRKVHIIDYKLKTIDGIPYIINSNCASISNPSTAEGAYCMAYGYLQNYEVPVFSPVEIGKSTDYKFKDGIICYKASVFTGGNVVGYNGFLRIKKATTSSSASASASSGATK